MSENLTNTQAFKLKGRLYTLTVIQILSVDKKLFVQQLKETVLKAPKMFDSTPVVFDLSAVNHTDCDLAAFSSAAFENGIIPVAIQGGSASQNSLAQEQHLAVLHSSSSQNKDIIERPPEAPSELIKSKLICSPVRSGQQIVAKGGDLIVTSTVGHGAELLADGNIHVYGALKGRALAGMSGDRDARIFCQSLEADLVSIAGFYSRSDEIEPTKGPCQVYLRDEKIVVERL